MSNLINELKELQKVIQNKKYSSNNSTILQVINDDISFLLTVYNEEKKTWGIFEKEKDKAIEDINNDIESLDDSSFKKIEITPSNETTRKPRF